jgi:hypothetical protein
MLLWLPLLLWVTDLTLCYAHYVVQTLEGTHSDQLDGKDAREHRSTEADFTVLIGWNMCCGGTNRTPVIPLNFARLAEDFSHNSLSCRNINESP